jgi:elongator complex protein 5
LTLLTHVATAIFRVSSLYQAIESRRSRERSLAEPEWGLREGKEGVLIGLRRSNGNGNGGDRMMTNEDGVVVEMEMRRRSGRAVAERFVLTPKGGSGSKDREAGWVIVLMADHPAFRKPVLGGDAGSEGGEDEEDGGGMQATFNLGLTEKQRRDREGVVLPYFDAQLEVGGGEGGRILYEMGREDDFDEEEDEI